jgi:hypothetical protein
MKLAGPPSLGCLREADSVSGANLHAEGSVLRKGTASAGQERLLYLASVTEYVFLSSKFSCAQQKEEKHFRNRTCGFNGLTLEMFFAAAKLQSFGRFSCKPFRTCHF